MITVFGESNNDVKPLVRYGKKIPGYYALRDGRIYSTKRNKFIAQFVSSSAKIKPYLACSISLPIDIFGKDHKFFQASYKKKSFNLKLEVHRLIAESFIPIDECPPIPLEDWKNTPESAKQFIRESAIVDHIDPDINNNSADNLRWVTPRQNNPHRKKQQFDAIKIS